MNSTAQKYEKVLRESLEARDICFTNSDEFCYVYSGRLSTFSRLIAALDASEKMDFFQENIIRYDANHVDEFFTAATAGQSSIATRWVNDAMNRLLETYEDFLRQEAHDLKRAIAEDIQQQYERGT